MRKISRTKAVAVLTAILALPATATTARGEDIYYLNQTQSGFNLPGVTLPQGQDEVHASDGTTCRSAVGGSGAYLDVGAINGSSNRSGEVSTYGRVVIPLGRSGKRLDCSQLYELEVARLKMELKLLQMGMSGGAAEARPAAASADDTNWAKEGWSDDGVRAAKR